MIPRPDTGGGGGGSVSITSDDDDSGGSSSGGSSYSTTSNDDPFSGGKTGSEVLAEAGDPASVVTSDPDTTSVEEKMEEDGIAETVNTFTDLAQDGDDSNDGATFDEVSEENSDDLQDGVDALGEAAQNVVDGGGSSSGGDVPSQAETAARNAMNAMSDPLPDDLDLPGGGLGDLGGRALAIAAAAFVGLLALLGGN